MSDKCSLRFGWAINAAWIELAVAPIGHLSLYPNDRSVTARSSPLASATAGPYARARLAHRCRRFRKAHEEEGVPAIGFEQFTVAHDRGVAGGETRIFRTAYCESPGYVPLLIEARNGWRNLESEAGTPLLDLNGVVTIGNLSMDRVLVGVPANDS